MKLRRLAFLFALCLQALPCAADDFTTPPERMVGLKLLLVEYSKIIPVFGVALIAAGAIGSLYVRDWRLDRGMRKYRVGLGESIAFAVPGPSLQPRRPLFMTRRGESGGILCSIRPRPHGIRNQNESGRIQLSRAQLAAQSLNFGFLKIQAEGHLHEIHIDGEFVGMAPARLRLAEGRHWVELKRVGRNSCRRAVKVIGGSECSLRAVLAAANPECELVVIP